MMSDDKMGSNLARYYLLSISGRWVIGWLKYKISKAKRLTCTYISLIVVAFLDLVDKT